MTSVFVIADIEGSTGCLQRSDAQLFNDGWVRACVEMSHDINCLGQRLLSGGAGKIRVKDFHRTGYNLFRELIDSRIELDQGYQAEPIVGIGTVEGFDTLIMTGMHAASGTEGFLPHTLTSKFASVTVNGQPITEAELFASSLAPAGLIPAFFSGCGVACRQAADAIRGMHTFVVDKPLHEGAQQIRTRLADAAAQAIDQIQGRPFQLSGPFNAVISMRDGEAAAAKLRKRWQMQGTNAEIFFSCPDANSLYRQMINLAYLTPFTKAHLNIALKAADISGRLAHYWARRRAKQLGLMPVNLRGT